MSAVPDNRALATAEPSAVAAFTPRPPVLRNNALMDALFRNLTRFFAFAVFSLLAAILVSLVLGSRPSLDRFGTSPAWSLSSSQCQSIRRSFRAAARQSIYGRRDTPRRVQ